MMFLFRVSLGLALGALTLSGAADGQIIGGGMTRKLPPEGPISKVRPLQHIARRLIQIPTSQAMLAQWRRGAIIPTPVYGPNGIMNTSDVSFEAHRQGTYERDLPHREEYDQPIDHYDLGPLRQHGFTVVEVEVIDLTKQLSLIDAIRHDGSVNGHGLQDRHVVLDRVAMAGVTALEIKAPSLLGWAPLIYQGLSLSDYRIRLVVSGPTDIDPWTGALIKRQPIN